VLIVQASIELGYASHYKMLPKSQAKLIDDCPAIRKQLIIIITLLSIRDNLKMSEIISAAVLLILIMDPLGNLPIFMSVLKHTEPKRRRAIMIRELLIALLVMFIFLFAGEKFLAFLNLRRNRVDFRRDYSVPDCH
jgi:Ca2+/Na+ antiporter